MKSHCRGKEDDSVKSQLEGLQKSSYSAQSVLIKPTCQEYLFYLIHSGIDMSKTKLLISLECDIDIPLFLL